MAKIQTFFIGMLVSLVFIVMPTQAATQEFLFGDGSTGSPYVITTAEHLSNIYKYPDANFVLMQDIDMNGKSYVVPDEFRGSINGDGYAIVNLSITSSVSSSKEIGLVDNLSGSITNLTLKDCKIYSGSSLGCYSGAFAATVTKTGRIENCHNKNTTVTSKYSHAAGIAGYVEGTITKCSNTGDITANEYDINNMWLDCRTDAYAGGIAAYAEDTEISKCFNDGNIRASKGNGGIAGYAYSVKDCFNTGTSYTIGMRTGPGAGICGTARFIENCYSTKCNLVGDETRNSAGEYVKVIPSVTNCYFCPVEDERLNGKYGTRLLIETMKEKATYVGFDFDEVWEIGADGYRLPSLKGLTYEMEYPKASVAGFDAGTGTYYDPYVIVNVTQLNKLSSYPGAFYSLEADIDLSQNLGVITREFNGTFYGNNHTISGAYVVYGNTSISLFGDGAGNVSDLVIKNSSFGSTVANSSISAVMGVTTGKISNITIEEDGFKLVNPKNITKAASVCCSASSVSDCVNYAEVTGLNVAAGIVVTATNTTNCVNHGVVTGGSNVGGISCSNTKITGCINYSNVYSNSELGTNIHVGGVTGSGNAYDCVNYGRVEVSGSGVICVGGIVGDGKAIHCYNTAYIKVENTTDTGRGNNNTLVGGIAGKSLDVEKCENKGDILVKVYPTEGSTIGGIVAKGTYISDCINYGRISTQIFYSPSLSDVKNYGYAGGIAGQVTTNCTNCYNEYDININTNHYTGSIVAQCDKMDLSTCYFYSSDFYNKGVGKVAEGTIYPIKESCFSDTIVDKWKSFDFQNVWTYDEIAAYPYYLAIIGFATDVKAIEYATPEKEINMVEGLFPNDFSVNVTLTNDEQKIIQLKKFMLDNFDASKIGTQVVKLNYQGIKSENLVTVNVREKAVTEIGINTNPTKLTYKKEEEDFDVTGGKLEVKYDNETSEIIDITNEMISGFDNTKEGDQKITITYEGCTASFNVFVKEATGIAVKKVPSTITYVVDEEVNLYGMEIALVYSDQSTEKIDLSEVEVSYDNTQIATTDMTISACGFTSATKITFVEKRYVGCELIEPTYGVKCSLGEDLDVSEISIKEEYYRANSDYYTNTRTVPVTLDMISGFDCNKVGVQKTTVTYKGYNFSMFIAVSEDRIAKVVFKTLPNKTKYNEGEQFDLTGATVEETYESGRTKVFDLTSDMITNYGSLNMNAAGTYTLTIRDDRMDITVSHISVIDHAVAATCQTTGLKEGSHCSVCGAVIKAQEVVEKLAHSWNEGSIVKNPTCTETGEKHFECTVCGETKTETIAKLGHKEVIDNAVPSTCHESGLTEGSHCSVCGTVIKEQKVTPIIDHNWDSGKITKAATCTEAGVRTFECTVCGKTKTESIVATGHSEEKKVTMATTFANGSITYTCSKCHSTTKNTETISYPKSINLSKTNFVYNGRGQRPTVSITDSAGVRMNISNYKVEYSPNCKTSGSYNVRITFLGNYSGTVTKTFKIVPKATTLSKLTPTSKSFKVTWKKQATDTTGYQLQYSTDKSFKGAKTVLVNKNKTITATVKKLKAKKKYYVRIRTYKTVGKSKNYSAWSKAKAVTTKK